MEIVLAAVQQNGEALEHAPATMALEPSIVTAALRSNSLALTLVPDVALEHPMAAQAVAELAFEMGDLDDSPLDSFAPAPACSPEASRALLAPVRQPATVASYRATGVKSQLQRDRERMAKVRSLCPIDGWEQGLRRSAGDDCLCVPDETEQAAIKALAGQFGFPAHFVYFRVVWYSHVATVLGDFNDDTAKPTTMMIPPS